jgi:FkbM family methyltransferase
MKIEKIEEKILDELKTHNKAYNKVDVCNIEGLAYPVILRQNTLDEFVANEIFSNRFYDASMKNSRHYSDYIEEYNVREPKYIIDAGGNIGLAAIFFAVTYPNAEIITIEPDVDNYFLLCENIKHYSNIKAINGAVWDKQTKVCISNRKWSIWENGTLNAGKYIVDETEVADEEYIPAFTIDYIIEKYGIDKIDILKMDVEGAEREIFAGEHEKWLPKVKILVLEHHDFYKPGATKSLFKALSNYDFHFFYDHSDNSLENMMFFFDNH